MSDNQKQIGYWCIEALHPRCKGERTPGGSKLLKCLCPCHGQEETNVNETCGGSRADGPLLGDWQPPADVQSQRITVLERTNAELLKALRNTANGLEALTIAVRQNRPPGPPSEGEQRIERLFTEARAAIADAEEAS